MTADELTSAFFVSTLVEAMSRMRKLKVNVKYEKGWVTCLCLRGNKRCKGKCDEDIVYLDVFDGWENGFHQDRFGRGKR